MKFRIVVALVAGLVLSLPAAAAEKKPAKLRDFPFWSAEKQPHARDFIPGLSAALQLTPEQVEKIESACRETIDPVAAKGKNAPGGAEAREKLHKLVDDILTAQQKTLIEKINDAFGKAAGDTNEEFQDQFAAAKGNAEEQTRLRKLKAESLAERFGKRLQGILSNEQMEAVKKAADERKKAEANKPPKPGK